MTCPNPSSPPPPPLPAWYCPPTPSDHVSLVTFWLSGVVDGQEIDMLASSPIFCPNYAGYGISPYNSWAYPFNATVCGSLCSSGCAGCILYPNTIVGAQTFTVGGSSSTTPGSTIFEVVFSNTNTPIVRYPSQNSLFNVTFAEVPVTPYVYIKYLGIQTITFTDISTLIPPSTLIYMKSSDSSEFLLPLPQGVTSYPGYYSIDMDQTPVVTIGLAFAISTTPVIFYSDLTPSSTLENPIFTLTMGSVKPTVACSDSSFYTPSAATTNQALTISIDYNTANQCPVTLPGTDGQILEAGYIIAQWANDKAYDYPFALTAVDVMTQILSLQSSDPGIQNVVNSLNAINSANSQSSTPPYAKLTDIAFWNSNPACSPNNCMGDVISAFSAYTTSQISFPNANKDISNLTIQKDLLNLFCSLCAFIKTSDSSHATVVSTDIVALYNNSSALTDGFLTAFIAVLTQWTDSNKSGSLVTTTDPASLTAVLKSSAYSYHTLAGALSDAIKIIINDEWGQDACTLSSNCSNSGCC